MNPNISVLIGRLLITSNIFKLEFATSKFSSINKLLSINKGIILNLKNNGTTIIFSTHRMESIEELCDEICLMNNGNKILDGNVIDIKKKFQQDIFKINYEGKLIRELEN